MTLSAPDATKERKRRALYYLPTSPVGRWALGVAHGELTSRASSTLERPLIDQLERRLRPSGRHRLVELVDVQIGSGDATDARRIGAAAVLSVCLWVVAKEVQEAIADRLGGAHLVRVTGLKHGFRARIEG